MVLWLAGQGLGWFGRGADSFAVPQGEPEAALPAVRGPGAARVLVPDAATAVAVSVAQGGHGDQGTREGAEPVQAPAASPAGEPAPVRVGTTTLPAPAAVAAADAAEALDDAVASGAALVRFLLAERRHARGEAALAALAEVAKATPPGRAVVASLAAELDALASALVDELAAALTAGQVLVAADLWSRLCGAVDRPTAEVVVQRLAAQGLELLLRPLPSTVVGSAGGEPVPLPRQRRVRVAGLGLARLVRWEARQASVDAGKGTFPVVPHHDLEPIDATADEAVEMGWAAGCGGAWATARLWLLCAERRAGPGGLGARAVSLRALCGG